MANNPRESESSYLRTRDRNGCIGCLGILAGVIACAVWFVILLPVIV